MRAILNCTTGGGVRVRRLTDDDLRKKKAPVDEWRDAPGTSFVIRSWYPHQAP